MVPPDCTLVGDGLGNDRVVENVEFVEWDGCGVAWVLKVLFDAHGSADTEGMSFVVRQRCD